MFTRNEVTSERRLAMNHRLSGIISIEHPIEFWSRIKKRNRPVDSEDVSSSDFHDYFSTFSNSSSDHNLHNYACTNTHIYDLDKPITENEVENVISNMSRGKSSGLDDLINEMFIDSRDILSPYLARIFNHLFDNSLYPAEWLKGKIVPIPKKGETNLLVWLL